MKNTTNTWCPIPGYEQEYAINVEGQVQSLHKRFHGRILSTRVDRGGYLIVKLSKHGRTSTCFIHRLLAQTFIQNLHNKPQVNHKNGNKLDNRLANLEWVTPSENMEHAFRTKLIVRIGYRVKNTCTGEVFPSIAAAARRYDVPRNSVKAGVRGRSRSIKCLRLLSTAA